MSGQQYEHHLHGTWKPEPDVDWEKIAGEIEDERADFAAMVERVEALAAEWERNARAFPDAIFTRPAAVEQLRRVLAEDVGDQPW